MSICGGGVDLEQMLAKRDREIVRLREEVQRLQLTVQEVQSSTANHIAQLQQQLANKIMNIEILKTKLDSQQDYEKIKEELRVLKERKQVSEHHLLSKPPAEDSADFSVAGLEIKREIESPSKPQSCTELVDQFSKQNHISWRTTPTSPSTDPQCSSCPSPHDPLPLCSKSDHSNEGSLQTVDQNDLSGNVWAASDVALYDNVMDVVDTMHGRSSQDVEKQFETSEITQQVKEVLHKHKIGQRAFGHYVLGRLQGSVSEILAHPKPWSKLTTRGKEPFLKMIHFLSDEQNVLTLRMIQDKARSNSLVINSTDTGCDQAIRNILKQAEKELQSEPQGNEKRIQQHQSTYVTTHDYNTDRAAEDLVRGILEQARHELKVQQHTKEQEGGRIDSLVTSGIQLKQGEGEETGLNQTASDHNLLSEVSPADFVQNIIQKVKNEIGAKSLSCPISALLPSVGPDPSSITLPPSSKTRHNHSLSRKLDEVLSRSTGMKMIPENVTDSLIHVDHLPLENYKDKWQPSQAAGGQSISQPLSDLYTGLHAQKTTFRSLELDTLSITRQVKGVLAENKLAYSKRPFIFLNTESDRSLQDSTADHPEWFKTKRARVVLSSEEKEILSRTFQIEPYPSHHTIQRLALQLRLHPSTVTNWFYNHRSRLRRTVHNGRSLIADYSHSPILDPEVETQLHCSDSDLCSYSSVSCTDTNLVTIKGEPSDVISEERQESTQYVSTGVQFSRTLKLEVKEDWRSSVI